MRDTRLYQTFEDSSRTLASLPNSQLASITTTTSWNSVKSCSLWCVCWSEGEASFYWWRGGGLSQNIPFISEQTNLHWYIEPGPNPDNRLCNIGKRQPTKDGPKTWCSHTLAEPPRPNLHLVGLWGCMGHACKVWRHLEMICFGFGLVFHLVWALFFLVIGPLSFVLA